MQTLTVAALDKNLPVVNDFIHSSIESYSPSQEVLLALDLAVEELFVNVAHYAYAPDTGDISVTCSVSAGQQPVLSVSFSDSGVPYNPLLRPDPDLTQKLEDRRIGGMGIYLTKKYMDGIAYTYIKGRNIVTITKALKPSNK